MSYAIDIHGNVLRFNGDWWCYIDDGEPGAFYRDIDGFAIIVILDDIVNSKIRIREAIMYGPILCVYVDKFNIVFRPEIIIVSREYNVECFRMSYVEYSGFIELFALI